MRGEEGVKERSPARARARLMRAFFNMFCRQGRITIIVSAMVFKYEGYNLIRYFY